MEVNRNRRGHRVGWGAFSPEHMQFPTFRSVEEATEYLSSDPRPETFRAVLGAASGATLKEEPDINLAVELLQVLKERINLLPDTNREQFPTEKRLGLAPITERESVRQLHSLAVLQLQVTGHIRLP